MRPIAVVGVSVRYVVAGVFVSEGAVEPNVVPDEGVHGLEGRSLFVAVVVGVFNPDEAAGKGQAQIAYVGDMFEGGPARVGGVDLSATGVNHDLDVVHGGRTTKCDAVQYLYI